MRIFLGILRHVHLMRLIRWFVRGVWRGDPSAIGLLGLMLAAAVASGLWWFARRPLGGHVETALDDPAFRDEANPYRDLHQTEPSS